MKRSFFDAPAGDFAAQDKAAILGALTAHLPFSVDEKQRQAWTYEIEHLKGIAKAIPGAHIFLEFMIPRMGRRVDAIIVYRGIVFVLEYKVGKDHHGRNDIDQTLGYALDLKNFHESSHHQLIVPILIATKADARPTLWPVIQHDDVAATVLVNAGELERTIKIFAERHGAFSLDALTWAAGRYKPTPTIIEAAQALYRGHEVEEIARSEASAENLGATSDYINKVIEASKARRQKSICFITGVPGSGKTLAGFNIISSRMKAHGDEHAVFLSGNGPLVDVLRAALTGDKLEQLKAAGKSSSKAEEYQKACAFIQNTHHFRDENLQAESAPVERVVVFDEAQRAWNVEQTSRFMQEKRGRHDFSMSEPELLLSVMDRHEDWCTVICLVGEGQEINTGEAGITEWLTALHAKFPHWQVHVPDSIANRDHLWQDTATQARSNQSLHATSHLHLAVSLRSFRAERLSDFVGALIDGDESRARILLQSLKEYPLLVTRNLAQAREWLRSRRRATERTGLLASSNALRLKPEGIFVKAKIDPPVWFLAPPDDIRSSNALEDAGSEFDVQGLEIDWACVCWDANLRHNGNTWTTHRFQGTKWQQHSDASRVRYLLNSYRVLLTRARQGLVIFVPEGDIEDSTRLPEFYDPIYRFLLNLGIPSLSSHSEAPSIAKSYAISDL